MTYEPGIIISDRRDVLQKITAPETLVSCWDACRSSEFSALFEHIHAFKDEGMRGYFNETGLNPVVAYAEQMIDEEIEGIITEMERAFSGYDPLHIWAVKPGDEKKEETIPHRDHPCVGIFFYFNELVNLSTFCVPEEYAGEGISQGSYKIYPNANLNKAVILPPQSVALIKLGEITHFGPSEIPEGEVRIVMHARYDMF